MRASLTGPHAEPSDDPSEETPGKSGHDKQEDRADEQQRLDALYLLARGIDACTVCGGAHRPTQCPEVRAVREEMEYHARLAEREDIKRRAAEILAEYQRAPIWQEAA